MWNQKKKVLEPGGFHQIYTTFIQWAVAPRVISWKRKFGVIFFVEYSFSVEDLWKLHWNASTVIVLYLLFFIGMPISK